MSIPNIIARSATLLILVLSATVMLKAQGQNPAPIPQPSGTGISLAPARLELEMQPGSETTVVVNLDYHTNTGNSQPIRIVASLNDWTIDRTGQVRFEKPNTLPNSASSWLIYSPAETTVIPGNLHAIRVTVSVPKDATPGDHLTALVIEQRPENIKLDTNRRQMVIKYRMAAAFYIKVPQLRRQGSLENLKVEAKDDELTVTPLLKNSGNSVIRPLTSLRVMNGAGKAVLELPQAETLPLLGGSELMEPLVVQARLAPGTYTASYRVDFQDGSRPTEGVTEFVIRESQVTSNAPKPVGQTPTSNE
jgi:hypothetical protein